MTKLYLKTFGIAIVLVLCSTFSQAQITTVFGRHTYLGDGGTALNAGLYRPYAVVRDNAGNLYIASTDDNRIRKVAAGTNVITSIAGTGIGGYSGDGAAATNANFYFATGLPGLTLDNKGNLYVGDYGNNRVRKINLSTGIVTTIAGTGVGGYSGDGGQATSAKLSNPAGLAFDTIANKLFIVDNNNSCVRQVDMATGIITTVAGNGNFDYSGDGGLATQAALNYPEGIAVDKSGNLYIADEFNYVIRKVDAATKKISTIAGTGTPGFTGDGGLATAATFKSISAVYVDAAGNVFICDNGNYRIRKVDASTKKVSTIAGTGISIHLDDEGASATTANINPANVLTDKNGDVYISDVRNNRVRKITTSTGKINTIVGDGTDGFTGAPDAPKAQLNPQAIAADASGNFYIADGSYYDVRSVNVANSSYIYAGSPNPDPAVASKGYGGNGGLASQALFNAPYGIAIDAANTVYVADVFNNVVRKIDYGTKIISNAAGNNSAGYSGDGGAATAAQLSNPYGLAVDATGNLYIADAGNNVIRMVDFTTKKISTVAGSHAAGSSGDGGLATAAKLNFPYAVALDALGNLFILDKGNNKVRKVTASTKKISTVFTNGDVLTGLATDVAGNIYVSDSTANTIVRIDKNNFQYQVVAGNGTKGYSGDGGAAKSAKLNNPRGLYIDALNQIYVADAGNNVVRKVIMGVLAIDNLHLTVTNYNGSALLQWQPTGEAAGTQYTAQRSTDAANWVTLTTVAGNSSQAYTATDAAPAQGTNYYRIKQTGIDGKITYSLIRSIVFSNKLAVRLYPNPVTQYAVLDINSDADGTAAIAIYTATGQAVKTLQQHINKGSNQITVNQLGSLAKGVYMIKVITPAGSYEGKIVR